VSTKVRLTRVELLRLRRRLSLAERANELLEDKEVTLVSELEKALAEYLNIYDEASKLLERIRALLRKAEDDMGPLALERQLYFSEGEYEIEAFEKRLMGIKVYDLQLKGPPRATPSLNLVSSSLYFFEARNAASRLAYLLTRLIELENKIRAIDRELVKVRRRRNALEYVLIPDMHKMIEMIQLYLEEKEREELFRLRLTLKLGV